MKISGIIIHTMNLIFPGYFHPTFIFSHLARSINGIHGVSEIRENLNSKSALQLQMDRKYFQILRWFLKPPKNVSPERVDMSSIFYFW